MGLVQIRDFKTIISNRFNGTNFGVTINDTNLYQLPSNISWDYMVVTTKWTVHIPGTSGSYTGAGVIELTHTKYSSNNAVYQGTHSGNIAGCITGINSNVGSGFLGIVVFVAASATNLLQTTFVEGRASFYSGI